MSRELDALVSQHIFGESAAPYAWERGTGPSTNWIQPRDAKNGDLVIYDKGARYGDCKHLPCYSTDIAAAWEVVNKLMEDKYDIGILGTADGWDVAFGKNEESVYQSLAVTFEEAICKAALLAVGVDVEKELKL